MTKVEVEREKRMRLYIVYAGLYGEMVILHLTNDSILCTGCGPRCIHCRNKYDINFSSEIVSTYELPATLPLLIDEPEEYLPTKVPSHDVMLAINVHEDILLSLPQLAVNAGAKAILAPVEDPGWPSKGVQNQMRRICDDVGLEFDSPEPFCSLEEGGHPHIDEFTRHFRIGKPKLKIELQHDIIKNVEVLCSAPCGCTYFVAYNLIGVKIGEKLNDIIAKYWHSYPCVASMKIDPKFRDTILHKGGYNHRDAVHEALKASRGGFEI